MKASWQWFLLGFLSIAVLAFYFYFEIALILKLYYFPNIEASEQLAYKESLGIFAPGLYIFEGGVKLLQGLSPILRFINELLLLINSILLLFSIPVCIFVFKKQRWAGIVIVLLFLPIMLFAFDEIKGLFI